MVPLPVTNHTRIETMTNREASNLARRIPFTSAVNAGLPPELYQRLARIVTRQVTRFNMDAGEKSRCKLKLQRAMGVR